MIPGGPVAPRSGIICSMNATNPLNAAPAGLDVRGPRFGAVLTTVVLAAVLVTGSGRLLAAQAVVFAVGAAAGVRRSPYGWLFATLVRPRLGPTVETEDPAPPRFAQAVGLAFAIIGLIGYFAGPLWLAMAATGCALAAAFLNAAFGYCLGCEMYLLFRRATR
ncbi:hypothetical protein M2266_001135 [Streptomyces sp. SPB162]|nr:hypothetical protein [Streptomyces sp. SPB162]